MSKKLKNKFFTSSLLEWNNSLNHRPMPWKGEKDPYRIWLSEIILQQTRVEQGWQYYNKFIGTFPSINDLAKAPEEKVFKLWEGLGYYTRCKNLIATAKLIAKERKGNFPDTYEEIIALKGVGPYTAAAIASFAYQLPHAVVDGNVFRVLSRYFGIVTPVDSSEGKKLFIALADELLDKNAPGIYNQALMDFGATICKPSLPLCNACILKKMCTAYRDGTVNKLPVKEKSIAKKLRYFYYIKALYNDTAYVRKRPAKDIWENLYEFILMESDQPIEPDSDTVKKIIGKQKFDVLQVSVPYKQQLTHQTIQGQFISIRLQRPLALADFEAVPIKKLRELPFPKFILNYLTDKKLTLNL
ncbi:MAG: A/G-specific adenine glycosylase [Ferruginibacter sp.]